MADLTAIISRARVDDPTVREVECDLTKRFSVDFGMNVLVVPDLYDLPEDDPALEAVREVSGPLIVLAWMYPRATYWLLRQAGVAGERTDAGGDLAAVDEARPVIPVDLRGSCCADQVIERAPVLGAPSGGGPAGKVTRFDHAVAERWYPVLDYDRCVDCLECVEFCLFGVYDVDAAGRPTADLPERCKPGCPACSRVCPAAAIIFPRHRGTPAIAGADEGTIEALSPETASRDGITKLCAEAAAEFGQESRLYPCRPGELCVCSDPANCPYDCDTACDCHDQDPLERAINELDAGEV